MLGDLWFSVGTVLLLGDMSFSVGVFYCWEILKVLLGDLRLICINANASRGTFVAKTFFY